MRTIGRLRRGDTFYWQSLVNDSSRQETQQKLLRKAKTGVLVRRFICDDISQGQGRNKLITTQVCWSFRF